MTNSLLSETVAYTLLLKTSNYSVSAAATMNSHCWNTIRYSCWTCRQRNRSCQMNIWLILDWYADRLTTVSAFLGQSCRRSRALSIIYVSLTHLTTAAVRANCWKKTARFWG